ncbi:MAG: EAL domain-containing protein [Gammaproteobacteria bacterium]|nr:EAL domain-containing protein [Gammaproteobacteria bacterium]MBU1731628.1 EAL domain-containing protein [Gammaproteobacteria bacterium]MBU1893788.1 EAL domain-containing protein [Gammaproteobacteria bacterium]
MLKLTSRNRIPTFSRSLWLTLVLFVLLAIAFAIYAWTEKRIDRAHELRHQSYLLADQLRQSSDDLTRMVRAYVVTGDPRFKKYYQDILDIREGRKPRPERYHVTYWDFVLADGKPPRPDSAQSKELLTLMRQAGFTPDELSKLAEAKANSDALTVTEFEAMRLAESAGPDDRAARARIRMMVFGDEYLQARAAIMRPIHDFYALLDQRTRNAVHAAEVNATILRLLFIALGLGLMFALWRNYRVLGLTLGGSVGDVQKHIARIGSGDVSSVIPVAKGMEESVLGWLSETQIKLKNLDRERKADAASIQRLTQIYAALSQCNQAIVRCSSEHELFPIICRDAVQFGGMKMAWIGMVDEASRQVRPVASFGDDKGYLEGIEISLDPDIPSGRGPTSIAMRESQPFWCQDFIHDPMTLPWHERGKLSGWGASASLPLKRNGDTVGSFNLYSGEANAFDEGIRTLLVEMALDISFALDNFAREEDRKRATEALHESESRLRAVTQSASDAIITIDSAGNIVGWNGGAEAVFGYTEAEAIGQPVTMLMPLRYREQHLAGVNRVLSGGKSRAIGKTLELEGVRKDQSEFPLELLLAKCELAGGWFIAATIRDITERKRAEAQIKLAAEVFEQSSEAFIITDADNKIALVNHAFTVITGYSEAEVLGQNPRILASGRHSPDFFRSMWETLDAEGYWQGEVWDRRKDGSVYPKRLSISRVLDAQGNVTHYIGIFSDISEYKATEEHIHRLAHFDVLTGLPNRALLSERIHHDISVAKRSHGKLVVLFLDLDHFKNVNDTLGHRVGDELLIEVARRLESVVRGEDTVSRLGGDEFILVLPGTDADGAAHVAGKLLEVIARPYQIEQNELFITPSIGIAIFPSDGEDFDTLSQRADVAMYRAKRDGRNNYRFFTTEMQARSARTLQLENALRHALERDQLQLHYQPQVLLEDGRIIGAEALLRWQHPELGLVSPAEFIPIAENSGQILPIGEWVLRNAVRQLKTWIDAGFAPMTMAVNLSAIQFRHPRLSEMVSQILDEEKLPPKYLELELTESVAMDDPLAAIAVMDVLHECGIRMSIDDFGTGYSSLSYLKRFLIYKLKIDQSFVRDITDDPDDRAIVGAIISLASSLGMRTIAEGVETEGQLAFLREKGCNEVQGYYFSKPLPADQFELFMRSRI